MRLGDPRSFIDRWILIPLPKPLLRGTWREVWSEVGRWHFLAVFILVLIISEVLSHFWVFQYGGLFFEEFLNRRNSAHENLQPATHCELVLISDGDLDNKSGFKGKDPLSPEGLAEIINSILILNARVVAVDIDTSRQRYQKIPAELANNHKVVWARPGYLERRGWTGWIRALPVMGQRKDQEPAYSGIAMFPSDRDWTVRSYSNCVEIVGATSLPSFVSAIQQAFENKENVCEPGETSFHVLTDVCRFHSIDLDELSRRQEGFDGKIVLLGGSYSYHDRHPTPFGLKNGVEIVAMALESGFARRDHALDSFWHFIDKLLIKAVLALLVVLIHTRLRPVAAMAATMMVLSTLISFGMVIAYFVVDYSPTVVPFLIGIWIEQLIEGSLRAQKLAREAEEQRGVAVVS